MSHLVNVLSYSFLSPPMLFVVTAILGTCAAARGVRFGFATAFASLGCFWLLAMPLVSDRLIGVLEAKVPAATGDSASAGAIVVLGSDVQSSAAGSVEDAPGFFSLERTVMAAREYRASHLPVLVSGGEFAKGHPPLALLLAKTLETDFGVAVRWTETDSRNTYENAANSAAILRENGISTVVLVSQRWDMPRAIWAFRKFGITALPSKEARSFAPSGVDWPDFLPTTGSLATSFVALHELVGLFYYRIVYA